MKYLALAAVALMMAAQPALANDKHDGKHMEQKANAWFQKIDSNNDGKIVKSEHDAFGSKMFDDADTNNDDAISMDEMLAHKKKEKSEMKDEMKTNKE